MQEPLQHSRPPEPAGFIPFPDYPARLRSGYRFAYAACVRVARRQVESLSDAEDLVQAAIAHLVEHWCNPKAPRAFPRDDRHFQAVLLKCIHDRSVDATRRLQTIHTTTRSGVISSDTPLDAIFPPLTPEVSDTVDGTLEGMEAKIRKDHEGDRQADELSDVLGNLIEALPPKTADVLVMTHDDNLPRGVVAQQAGIQPKTVDWHLRRGESALRADLVMCLPVDPEDDEPWQATIRYMNRRYEAEKARKAKAPIAPNTNPRQTPP